MGLTDVTGVLSRYFVVGFYMPWFFALAVIWQAATDELLPDEFQAYGPGTQLAVVAALALLAALAASGLNYHLFRLLEGYPLEALAHRPVVGRLHRALQGRQERRYAALVARRDDEAASGKERTSAAWKLDRLFPDGADRVLPTRLGNAIRAFEDHPYKRWGIDGVGLWPRVEMMLTADEREPYIDAKIDVNVFVNAAAGAFFAGLVLIGDAVANAPLEWYSWWAYLLPFAVSYVAYRPAVGAAVRWGSEVRAVYDLHRLALYERFGLRPPRDADDERAVAKALNRAVMWGAPIDAHLWKQAQPPSAGQLPGGAHEPRKSTTQADPAESATSTESAVASDRVVVGADPTPERSEASSVNTTEQEVRR